MMYSPEIHRDMASAQFRQDAKDLELCKKIVTTMGGDGSQRVVLTGKSGIGKTRLAMKVSEHATKEGLCYSTLILHLNERLEDEWLFYNNIAFQIEVYDINDKEEKRMEDLLKALKEKIIAELSRKKRLAEEQMREKMRSPAQKKANKFETEDFPEEEKRHTSSTVMPYLLLILDDEGNKTRERKVMEFLGLERFLKDYAPLKILITRRQGDEDATKHEEEIVSDDKDSSSADTKWVRECEFHTTDESETLLHSLTEDNMEDLFASLINDEARELLKSLEKAWKIDEPLISILARKSNCLPAAIVVLAKSLNCITLHTTFQSLSPSQEKVFKEFVSPYEPSHSGYSSILKFAYRLLETDDTLKNAIVDCFWHSLNFFDYCGCIHYNELITQWVLEGYFDPVRSVKKAYQDGHNILVELINRGILKIQEDDKVVPEMVMDNLIDLRHHGLLGRSRLQFATVYGGEKKKGLGKITQIDDMIKTVQANKGDIIRTILVSGNRLRRKEPGKFFRKMLDLKVVVLFDPTSECLTRYLKELRELRVLVIRNCDLLSDIEELKGLTKLHVLEVSGASSITCISDEFFKELPRLQSLNLSGLRIKYSPSSISELVDLCSLILRDCPVLEDLPDIQELSKLEVLDVRGSHKLRTCFGFQDGTSRNRTFYHLGKLQVLDFSETKLKRLPVFHDAAEAANLHSLTRLSLRNCSNLVKLPNLRPLSGLQILDLSGTTSLLEVAAVCFEQKEELKILNFSGTKLTKLPSTIYGLSSLSQLLLRDNSNLEALPNIKGLTSLEVFDVSGCTNLHKIEGSFEEMSYLREVNLSGTKIETLPELPVNNSLCCSKLVVLADSRSLIRESWSQVKEAISNGMPESLSSIDTIQDIKRKELASVGELWAFDCSEKKGCHIYRDVYINTIPFLDTKNFQEVLEIQGSNGIDEDMETLAKVESVAIVDKSAESLSSIFKDLKSVKACWVEMCGDIEILFSGVDEERLGNLETLSITNLPWLESICSSSFKNLKKLSLDCCPRIEMLFPASAIPTSLEVLKIKFCEKLEKVFEQEVEMPNLHALCLFNLPALSTINAILPNLKTYKKDKCPVLETSKEDLCGPVSPTDLETI